MKIILRVFAPLLLALPMLSCSTSPRVEPTDLQSVINSVKVGDEVAITSKHGKVYRFAVTRITNKALYGQGYRVGYEEMSTIETNRSEGPLDDLGKLF